MRFDIVAKVDQVFHHCLQLFCSKHVWWLSTRSECLLQDIFLFQSQRFPAKVEVSPEFDSSSILVRFVVMETCNELAWTLDQFVGRRLFTKSYNRREQPVRDLDKLFTGFIDLTSTNGTESHPQLLLILLFILLESIGR